MAIVDKLKDLYIKAGGNENESANTITEWLAKINAVLGGDNAGSPSNIEDWVDKIEDVYSAGSGTGSSIEWVSVIDDTCTFIVKEPGVDDTLIEATAQALPGVDTYSLLNQYQDDSTIIRLTIGTVFKAIGARIGPDSFEFFCAPYFADVNNMGLTNISIVLYELEGSFAETSYTYPVKVEISFLTGLN